MLDFATNALLWFSAIGCGLIGGLFFAFSTFIMRALASIEASSGIAAMNAINDFILRSLFMPCFWGTTLASAGLAIIALFHWAAPAAKAMFAGGLIYVFGMFVCTIAGNVPLNNALARAGATGDASLTTWQRYLKEWTRWNHVRTVACTVSCALFIWVLTLNS